MAFFTGTGTQLQIGKEASFGEAATPDTLVDLTSEGIKVTVEKGDEGSLLGSKTAMSRDLLGAGILTSEGCVQDETCELGSEDEAHRALEVRMPAPRRGTPNSTPTPLACAMSTRPFPASRAWWTARRRPSATPDARSQPCPLILQPATM